MPLKVNLYLEKVHYYLRLCGKFVEKLKENSKAVCFYKINILLRCVISYASFQYK